MTTEQIKSAADTTADLITLASIQVVHADAGWATWNDVVATLERALEAAAAAADEVSRHA